MHASAVVRSAALCVASAVTLCVAAPTTPAVIQVADSVVAYGVEPLGANVGEVMGGTNYSTNQFIHGGGFEPAYLKYLRRVDRFGTNWIEWDGDGGVHAWDQCSTGFGNGATVRIYRVVNASDQPLAWSTGGDMSNPTGADHVVLVGEFTVPMPGGSLPQGGWIAQGSGGATNRVYLDRNATIHRGDYAFISIKKLQLKKSEINGRLYQYNSNIESVGLTNMPSGWTAKLVAHPGTKPQAFIDEDPGESCLEVTAASGTRDISQYLFHAYDNGEGQWYGALTPGAQYKVDVWLRQDGLANSGRVRFASNQSYSSISQTWTVTSAWQKFSYEFTGPAYPNSDAWHHVFLLEATGPGKLYVDNWVVYQNDAAHENRPFSPCTLGFNEYMRTITPLGPKPTARFYPTTFPTTSPMERLLSNWASSDLDFIYNLRPGLDVTIPHCLHWAYRSGATPETRIVPYFTLRVENSESEWKALVEYLGVPYDPVSDSPQSKPWAYMRYKQRGTGVPWTDEFREIIVEYGNESWHNGAGGYGWYGFGAPSFVWGGGVEYGLFARYMFDEQVAAMPAWSQYSLGSKIKFALNGGYMVGANEYGEVSVRKTRGAVKYLTHANYVGPKWETGDPQNGSFDNDGIQRTLVAADPEFKSGYLAKHAQFRDEAKALGVNYDLVIYEGGPSGYYVSGATDQQKEIAEQYGKSVAMAVAALDAWMYSGVVGYKHQNYLGYGCGGGWSSHTQAVQGGFRQHCGWMAMAMRNNHARGDRLVKTTFSSTPTFNDAAVSDSSIPLISAYTLSNPEKTVYSVFLLSRKLGGTHNNGVNFGDGFTPVTINLPFTQRPQAIYLHRLARRNGTWTDPTLSNRDSLRVVIKTDTISPAAWNQSFVVNASTGADSRGLPPGNIFLYVFAIDTTALSVSARRGGVDLTGAGIAATGVAASAFSSQTSAAPVSSRGADAVAAGHQSVTQSVVYQPQVAPSHEMAPVVGALTPAAASGMRPVIGQSEFGAKITRGESRARARSMKWARGGMHPVAAVRASTGSGKAIAEATLDGDLRSRWAPSADGAQWLEYDLGVPRTLDRVSVVWYSRKPTTVRAQVMVSVDGSVWAEAGEHMFDGRGTRTSEIPFETTVARYVKVVLDAVGMRVPSVYEVGMRDATMGQVSSVQ